MGQFDDLLKLMIGGVAVADFQLEDYTYDCQPVIKDSIGRVGTSYNFAGKGWIEKQTAADFSASLGNFHSSFSVSGKDVAIRGLSNLDEIPPLLASQCTEGGPHVGFKILEQMDETACFKRFQITIVAKKGGDGTFTANPNTYKESVDTEEDGLRRVTRTGQLTQADAANNFAAAILGPFKASHPSTRWEVTFKYEIDQANLNLTYTLTAQELMASLPGGGLVVKGEGVLRKFRDEQQRQTNVYEFNLTLSGTDYQPVIDTIRSEAAAFGAIMRESVEVTRFEKIELHATFEILTSADGTKLLNWQQSFDLIDNTDTWEQKNYPGADPIAVKQPKRFKVLTQSGSATGAGTWISPPDPVYPEALSEPPRIRREKASDYEFVTSWTYTMLVLDDSIDLNNLLAGMGRPTT